MSKLFELIIVKNRYYNNIYNPIVNICIFNHTVYITTNLIYYYYLLVALFV